MNQAHDAEDEKPLDPATERLRRKMVRLLAVSVGTMMVGVMAVLGAIVYKLNTGTRSGTLESAASGGEMLERRLELPQGAQIVSASLDGERVLVQLRMVDETRRLLVYSLDGGRILATVEVD